MIIQNFKKIRINAKRKNKESEVQTLLEKRKLEEGLSRGLLEEQLYERIFERSMTRYALL